MNIEQEHILEKLVQYLDGTLSTKENLEVEKWIETNKEIEAQYKQLKLADSLMKNNHERIPSDRMTSRFEQWLDLYEAEMRVTKQRRLNWYKIAAGFAILLVGYGGAVMISKFNQQQIELTRIKAELQATKDLVMDNLNNQNSASQRMKGIYASQDLTTPDQEILQVLIKTMNTDPNSNVRVTALEALGRFYNHPEVRSALIQSLGQQEDPVVQIALIQMLVQKKETVIVKELESLTRQEDLIKAVKDEAYKGIFKLT